MKDFLIKWFNSFNGPFVAISEMNIDSGQTWFCIFVPTHDISWFSATFSRQFFERFEIFDGPSLYFNISKIFKISIFLIFLTFANCIIRMSDEDIPFRFKNPINVNTDTDSRKKWSILISRSVKKSIFSQKLQLS